MKIDIRTFMNEDDDRITQIFLVNDELEEDFEIELEFTECDNFVGMFDRAIEDLKIIIARIEYLKTKKNPLSRRNINQANSLTTMKQLFNKGIKK